MKKSSEFRFFNENLNAPKNWDEYMANQALIYEKLLASDEQKPFFNNASKYLKIIDRINNEIENENGFSEDLWYSNDFLINRIMLFFIDNVDEITREELRKVYIGKLDKEELNAIAFNISEEFEGYLITINFSLDIKLSIIAEVFTTYMHFKSHEVKNLFGKMLVNFILLLSDISKFNPKYSEDLPNKYREGYSEMSYKLYYGATAFLVAHELGHHLLKHTEVRDKGIMLDYIPNIKSYNINHAYEFAADSFAIDLMLKDKRYEGREQSERKISLDYLTSPLYVILSLAVETNDPTLASDTHPSLKDRYLNMISKIKEYCTDQEALILEGIFEQIANLIKITNKNWNKNWWE